MDKEDTAGALHALRLADDLEQRPVLIIIIFISYILLMFILLCISVLKVQIKYFDNTL